MKRMKNIYECRTELRSIINELYAIESGIRRDFTGIGEDLCANCVGLVADRQENALRKLNNVDPSRLADWILGTS